MSGSCHTTVAGKRHWLSTGHQHGVARLQNGHARLVPQLRLPRRGPLRLAAVASGHVPTDSSITGPQVILDRYRAMLHEYRAYKASLGDWITSIRTQHKRQPQLLDAEATGDAALVSRFQQYLMARKRLLAEIPLLREQLADSLEQQQQQHHQAASSSNYQQHKRPSSSSGGGQSSIGVVNANKVSVISKPQAIGQFFAAVNYRKQHGARTDISSSSAEQHSTAAVVAAAEQPVSAMLGCEQLTVTSVLPAAAVSSSASSSSNAGATSPPATAAAVAAPSARHGAVSHLLESATSSSSANAGSSRAAAAALAALSYKKRKQEGAAAAAAGDSLSSLGSQQQQRPLAVQLAAPPPPPPGYAADGTRLADGSSAPAPAVVLGTVETAKGDVYAGRQKRQLDADTSLEATLQGVPGGLGSTADGPMFAMAKAVQADAGAAAAGAAAGAAASSSESGSSSSAATAPVVPADDAVFAAAAKKAAATNAPVGQVVTAKFDVYSGRQRKLDPSAQLDDFFASIEQGHSSQLAAAAATASSSSSSNNGSSSRGTEGSTGKAPAGKQANSQRRAGFSSNDGGLLDLGMPDIMPLPT